MTRCRRSFTGRRDRNHRLSGRQKIHSTILILNVSINIIYELKRIAVILNEFGAEIGVERAMINEGDGGALVEEWVELANWCICCTVKHSLVQALEQLVQRKERLDHILLETTGLAYPAPLASILWLDDQLESAVKLDSIVTDVVILNKVDLVSSEDTGSALEELEKEIRNINSLANIIRSVRCQVDLLKILNCRAYDASVSH
ncbi:cobalamin biosynthesis CobW-like protein [Actinidia rufa]|uniref:Cobalamin biosynthesis CobW-like protein n=1 Tax=Actinidia rufa TaxID=165716 RepID=A0A7J0EQF2_9ERIC|nr:cobalamin biosynthesis CobW-like protein [Actinidia rufa]